ncbi:PREDICTED: FAST kinase domain-containing protein 5 isoform X2 [Vollenhovia emeryi]|uniref:FAST kinase domain-containing protein 5 isoform X2 n=1 Tax=Vollenhovia emeryi TaxID=411798 RepID=UPI0005F45B0D|nr:PREDICTED: FAST kinase domain-containing protein 5 isoform X2 [Vollenhovia emeryi]
MSVLVRGLGRLRGAYPALARLGSDSGNRVVGALPQRRRSAPSAVRVEPGKAQEGLAVPVRPADEDSADDSPKGKIAENTYAHNLFLNSLKYANIVMRPKTTHAYVLNDEALEILNRDWSSMTSAETTSAVKRLSYNLCNNNSRFEPLKYTKTFNGLNVQELTDDDLMTTMQHLAPFSSHLGAYDFYTDLCSQIDRECMTRFLRLPTEKMLYLCDVIYQMLPRKSINQYYSHYIWYSIRHLGNKPQKLSPQQLVQILFFLNLHRKPPINMYEFEFRLEQCFEDLSINEVAVASLGFFKTRTKIRSNVFLSRIIRRTINEIDLLDSVSIAALIKIIRFSTTLAEINECVELIKVITPYVPNYTLMTVTHIAQACGRLSIYDKELMDVIIEKFNRELKFARIKDIERFLYTFSIFNIDSSHNIYQNVIEELRNTWYTTRAGEIAKFPYVVSRIIGYLATQNVYPIDLIERIMAPEYLSMACNRNYRDLSREYCVLDYGLRVEVPEYTGPFLKPSISIFLEKKYYQLAEKTGWSESTRANMLFKDVLETCQVYTLSCSTPRRTYRLLVRYRTLRYRTLSCA